MVSGLAKIIELIRRTGDRCIVVDASGNPDVVILPLAEYERLSAGQSGGNRRSESLFESITQAAARPMPPPKPWGTGADELTPLVETPLADAADQYFFEPIE